jgi:beta-glucosidase
MGMTTILSPQIDLGTDPRWGRLNGSFGENLSWAQELAGRYVDGFQNSYGQSVWGTESMNAVIKHFGGYGANEGGRSAVFATGQYAVFPGDNLGEHMELFASVLQSAGVMTSWPIAIDADGEPIGDRFGTAFDSYRMGQLRNDMGFDGVVVTDWRVTTPHDQFLPSGWGTADWTVEERHFVLLVNGVDQFGGNSDVAPVMAAHEMWHEAYEAGELPIDAETRFRQTGRRVLTTLFQTGTFDNAFIDLDESLAIVGAAHKIEAGYDAQLASVVMLKNDGVAVIGRTAAELAQMTVYVPHTYHTGRIWPFSPPMLSEGPSLPIEILEGIFYAVVTDEVEFDADGNVVSQTAPDLCNVDIVLVGMDAPDDGLFDPGFDPATGEWLPVSLQWRPYTADGPYVRRVSISGNILEDGTRENRSYFGNSISMANEADLNALERAVAAVAASGREIPVVTVLSAMNPVVPLEIYEISDAIVAGFVIGMEALIEVAVGLHEPQGRLPMTFPASMDAVERQLEDVADTDPFIDSAGNAWGFGFGLSWTGVIR